MPEDTADELAWELRDRSTGYTCPGFDIVHDEVRLPDGTETDFDFVTEPPAVVVLPFTEDGDVVLIEEWRQAVARVNRGLPAGSLELDDDDLAAAAHRELTEETGYRADRVDHLTTLEPSNGISDSVHHHFVAHGCTEADGQALDYDETIRTVLADYDDVLAAIEAGNWRDGRSALTVLYFELFDP